MPVTYLPKFRTSSGQEPRMAAAFSFPAESQTFAFFREHLSIMAGAVGRLVFGSMGRLRIPHSPCRQ